MPASEIKVARPQWLYWRQVLGLSQVLLPADLLGGARIPAQGATDGNRSAPSRQGHFKLNVVVPSQVAVLAWTSADEGAPGQGLQEGERGALLNKMLVAAKLSGAVSFFEWCGPLGALSESLPELREALAASRAQLVLVFGEDLWISLQEVLSRKEGGADLGDGDAGMSDQLGRWMTWAVKDDSGSEVVLDAVATYDPQVLLQKPDFKRRVWFHLQEIMKKLGVNRGD